MAHWVSVVGILMCATVLSTSAYDQALTLRHLIWCAMTILLVLCTNEIRIGRVHIFAFGYLGFVLLSGLYAINKSEWVYSSSRAVLAVSYLSVVRIDRKLLTKAMVLLGVVFSVYFWWEYSWRGSFHVCKGLMNNLGNTQGVGSRNYWSIAHFIIVPFCYNAITKGYWKKLSIAVLCSMALNIILLSTRSVILALIVSACLVFVWHKSMRKWIIYGSIIAVEIAILVKGFKVFSGGSLGYRFGQWSATLKMIKMFPMGVGAGNWWIMFPKFAIGFDFPEAHKVVFFRHPHNNFIWIWAETGLGVAFYIGMIVYAIKKADRFLVIALSGLVAVACFSATHERPFLTLMLMTFIAMSCPMKSFRQPRALLTSLVFAMVVFGFRHRSACWNKKMRTYLTASTTVNMCEGYSPFSTMTQTGAPWLWWKGMSLKELKRYEEAIPLLKKAYEHNPYNIFVLNGIGIACGLEKNYYEAEVYFRRAVEICPDYEEAKDNLKLVTRINKWE